MTSLAKQLERLVVPRTQAILGDDKHKKSLLFDPSEAAALDRESFFSLGKCFSNPYIVNRKEGHR